MTCRSSCNISIKAIHEFCCLVCIQSRGPQGSICHLCHSKNSEITSDIGEHAIQQSRKVMKQNCCSATDHVFVTMPDSNHMVYHLSHVHLWLAKIADVARVRDRIFHLILRQVIQTFVRSNSHKTAVWSNTVNFHKNEDHNKYEFRYFIRLDENKERSYKDLSNVFHNFPRKMTKFERF